MFYKSGTWQNVTSRWFGMCPSILLSEWLGSVRFAIVIVLPLSELAELVTNALSTWCQFGGLSVTWPHRVKGENWAAGKEVNYATMLLIFTPNYFNIVTCKTLWLPLKKFVLTFISFKCSCTNSSCYSRCCLKIHPKYPEIYRCMLWWLDAVVEVLTTNSLILKWHHMWLGTNGLGVCSEYCYCNKILLFLRSQTYYGKLWQWVRRAAR